MGLPRLATFIIPTIGRPSLANAQQSIKQQSNDSWRGLVVLDGLSANTVQRYMDFDYLEIERQGSAGLVRNEGIEFALSICESDWIAFVDDDDQILPGYLDRLEFVTDHGDSDIVVFRMEYSNGAVLPPIGSDAIEWGKVGISFAIRSEMLLKNPDLRFKREDLTQPGPSGNEDVEFLLRARDEYGCRIIVDPTVQYLVRPT